MTRAKTEVVRVPWATHVKLQRLARETGLTMGDVVDVGVGMVDDDWSRFKNEGPELKRLSEKAAAKREYRARVRGRG